MEKNFILSQEIAAKKLERMAYEIIENNIDETEIILAGVRESGGAIARHIQQLLSQISSVKTKCISISLDKKRPSTVTLNENLDFSDKVIIVIDDVANTGKTMLYAMRPFLDHHPRKIQTLALVERTHKSFPIKTDYVGISVATTFQEHIYVEVEGNLIKGAYMN